MEPFIADIINNSKIPKIIRYLIVSLITGFIVYIGLETGTNSEMLWGKIFGFLVAAVFLILGIVLAVRIHKSGEVT